jgi:ERG8-type phosphomevalonate kinase
MNTKAKAYGKILLFGGYSILESGNIGLVVNVDKGTTTTVEETRSGRMVLNLKNFEIIVEGYREEHKLFFKKEPKVIIYLKNAIEYSYLYLKSQNIKLKDIKLISHNDPELGNDKFHKTGFGSSATATVSAVAAILYLHGIEDRDLVYKICRFSHYHSQGSGSGFDVFSTVYGSQFFSKIEENMDVEFFDYLDKVKIPQVEDFYWPRNLIPVIIFTGKSASTNKLVKKVLNFKKKDISKYNSIMRRYNLVNLKCKEAFINNNLRKISYYLEQATEFMNKLGESSKCQIIPKNYETVFENLKANGAYTANLVGAGGGDIIFCTTKTKFDQKNLIEYCNKRNLIVFDKMKVVNRGYELI